LAKIERCRSSDRPPRRPEGRLGRKPCRRRSTTPPPVPPPRRRRSTSPEVRAGARTAAAGPLRLPLVSLSVHPPLPRRTPVRCCYGAQIHGGPPPVLSSMARSGLPRACSAINGRSAAVAALHAATAAVPPCRRGLREIREKIFTLTLDNANNNMTACELLVIDCKYDLMFGGDHLHVRCCAHILNILVQDGMRTIHSTIKMIRELLKHIDSSPSRLQAFNSIANGKGVASKSWCLS